MAGSGITQSKGPVRRNRPRIERDKQRAARDAERDNTYARNRNWNKPDQKAEHHANPERDVAELRCGLHRVAKVLPDILLAAGRHQDADAVAKLKSQIRSWDNVHVIATNMQQMGWKASRHRQPREWNPDQAGLADEYADVVECRTVSDNTPRLQSSNFCHGFGDCLLAICYDHDTVAGGERQIGRRYDILIALANHGDLHAIRQIADETLESSPDIVRSERNLAHMKPLNLRRKFWLHATRHEIYAQDWADDSKGIGNRIADRCIGVFHDIKRGLQRGRAGHRTCVDAQRVTDLDIERLAKPECNRKPG